ncbi:MAG: gamma-glutamyl-phosphate reductase, partial [Desulfocapsa sp.]|nr:gamma-glutamyl-phosphate reductase [Desulfocapsa sp.]
MTSLENEISNMAQKARKAARTLVTLSTESKNNVLLHMADAIDKQRDFIQKENEKDLAAGKEKGLSTAMLDRLALTDAVIESMRKGLAEVAALPDPVGEISKMVK